MHIATDGCGECGYQGNKDSISFLPDELRGIMSSIVHTLAFTTMMVTAAHSGGGTLGIESLELKTHF